MENNKNLSLIVKWSNFINIILDPWVLLLIILVFALNFIAVGSSDKNVIAFTTIIISLVSSLLGGIIAYSWAQMTELKVLVARGMSAIRSLKLILLNITTVERRTKEYIDCLDKENKEYEHIVSNYEEMIEKCNILEEEVISSIENWTDIIPEVDNVKTQIGLVSDMKVQLEKLYGDISELNDQMLQGSNEKDELKRIAASKEDELKKTLNELKAAETKINASVLSGLAGSQGPIGERVSPHERIKIVEPNANIRLFNSCKKCGRLYTDFGNSDGYCERCQSPVRTIFDHIRKGKEKK